MAQPQIPIDVDAQTGIWRTDGLPMMYLPRHFMVNMQQTIEAAMGIEAYRAILYRSCHLSALQWCQTAPNIFHSTASKTFQFRRPFSTVFSSA